MTLSKLVALLALAATGCSGLGTGSHPSPAAEGQIRIVEHPGFFETLDKVYEVPAGKTSFVVQNRAGKNAGFVLKREGADPDVIFVDSGETGTLEVNLRPGKYTYFCPIIPSPVYEMTVK